MRQKKVKQSVVTSYQQICFLPIILISTTGWSQLYLSHCMDQLYSFTHSKERTYFWITFFFNYERMTAATTSISHKKYFRPAVHLDKSKFHTSKKRKTCSLLLCQSHGIANRNVIQTPLIKYDWCPGKRQKVKTENNVKKVQHFPENGPQVWCSFWPLTRLWGLNMPGDLWQLPLCFLLILLIIVMKQYL